jgi:uncharacterized protein (DUF488 family)
MDLRFGYETGRHHGGNMFKCSKKAWITKIMVKWLRNVWVRRPGALLKHTGMLVLDVFKGHLRQNMKTVTSNLNTEEQLFIYRLLMLFRNN